MRRDARDCHVLPAMDYSLPSELEVGVVNSWPHRPKQMVNPCRIVHAYSDVNTSFYGNTYTKFPGRQSGTRIPSKIKVIGPMPHRSTRSNRDAVMKIYEERKAAAAAGISHWTDSM